MALLKLLFLIETVALTAAPIGIERGCSVSFHQVISAINSKAHIFVDVTDEFSGSEFIGPLDTLKAIEERFPQGMIVIELSNSDSGRTITLSSVSYAVGDGQYRLVFAEQEEIQARAEFDTIRLTTNTNMQNILVYWKNGSV